MAHVWVHPILLYRHCTVDICSNGGNTCSFIHSLSLLGLYYLGNKYSNKIWKTPFTVCKCTKYVWPWVLIFGIAFLSLNYCSYRSGHWFVKKIEVILGLTLLAIFSVLQTFSKSTSWLHLITGSKILELEYCSCTQIEDLEK